MKIKRAMEIRLPSIRWPEIRLVLCVTLNAVGLIALLAAAMLLPGLLDALFLTSL